MTEPSVRPKSDEQDFAEIGTRLRAARAKAGVTRRQLAALSGTSERYLAHLEGGVGNPSIGVVTALAGALDLSVSDLLPQGGERSGAHARAAEALRRLPDKRLPDFHDWIGNIAPLDVAKARRIGLIGLRGAGKSSLGAELARRLRVPFIELTRRVEELYGGELTLLIELSGQAGLARYESMAWEAVLAEHEAAVIAAPGGIVANGPLFDRLLGTSHSIWLEAKPDDHMSRVMAQGDFRPMASTRGAMADLKAILDARTGEYSRADRRLDTSAQNFEQTAGLLERVARDLVGDKV